jgi:ubiquinone/menaquinone biosynthesis C-methylase UbiE
MSTQTDAVVIREELKTFWDGYSQITDERSMMLNEHAALLKDLDCKDIIRSLPDTTNMDVVDIGAGIGRFTSQFSLNARSVLAVDFIESFLEKNKERHAEFANVKFEVNDAVHLKLPKQSVDFVFTNWLMMYLTDAEVVAFLSDACSWLRPNGYLHLRESCSQPSSQKKAGDKFHSEKNPTFYRQKSQYLHLLSHICVVENGVMWQLQPQWAVSVPTYVRLEKNWRQVHMIIQKVQCSPYHKYTPRNAMQLQNILSSEALHIQSTYDARLEHVRTHLDNNVTSFPYVNELLTNVGCCALVIHASELLASYADPLNLSKSNADCRVWSVETNIFSYRAQVTHMNTAKNPNIRAQWTHSICDLPRQQPIIAEWDDFTTVVAFVSVENIFETVSTVKTMVKHGAKCILIVSTVGQTRSVDISRLTITGNVSITRLVQPLCIDKISNIVDEQGSASWFCVEFII